MATLPAPPRPSQLHPCHHSFTHQKTPTRPHLHPLLPPRTAIHLAARSGHCNVLRLLLDSRPAAEQEQLVNQPDFFGLTPVFLALQRSGRARAEQQGVWGRRGLG